MGGEECPKIARKDEFVYAFGLVTGTLRAAARSEGGAGRTDIPMDPAGRDRPRDCLPRRRGVVVPADCPARRGVGDGARQRARGNRRVADPRGGGGRGRAPRACGSRGALQVLMWPRTAAATTVFAAAVKAHAAALAAAPPDADWALLDAYATEVSLHQSDLVWTRRARTPDGDVRRPAGGTRRPSPSPRGPIPSGRATPSAATTPSGGRAARGDEGAGGEGSEGEGADKEEPGDGSDAPAP